MRNSFLKILNAEEQEANQVFLLLIKGFCMGTFLASFEVAASTLFLNHFDEQKDLPIAFILSGVLAVLGTSFFNFIQNRIAFKKVAFGLVAAMLVAILALRSGFSLLPNIKPLVFLAFALITPLNLITLLVFWGIFGRIFNAKQAKRIVSGIDVGQLTASIIALFTIPLIFAFIGTTQNLFWISAISVCFDLILTAIITKKFNLETENPIKEEKQQHFGYKALFTNSYLVLMATFVIVSVIAVFFTDYSFLSVVAAQFPETKDLANFISIFSGTIVLFIFIFQTFITNKIITEYGLGVSLLITPLLLVLFTVLAILTGSFLGYDSNSSGFVFFFLIIALSKLFTKSLKDALDTPVFKLCFLPLPVSNRFTIQAKIEGVVLAFAGLVAGGLQLLINMLAVFELIHYSFFLLPITLAWVVVAHKLHGKYREAIHETLINNKGKQGAKSYMTWFSPAYFLKSLISDINEEDIYLVKITQKIAPSILETLNLEKITGTEHNVKTTLEIDYQDIYSIKGQLQFCNKEEKLNITNLLAERQDLFQGNNRKESLIVLQSLLHDTDHEVKNATLITCGKLHVPETWPFLLEQLATINSHKYAFEALVQIGDPVLKMLDNSFYKMEHDDELLNSILLIFTQIGTNNAIELLWDKIDFPNQKISQEALRNFSLAILSDATYTLNGEKKATIYNLIEEEVGKACWNLAAHTEILNNSSYKSLKLAIEDEIVNNFDNIYLLLSLLYDPFSVQLVRENMESDTVEGIAFALELLNIFLAAELKKILFPLLEDIPVNQKLHLLYDYFPRPKFTSTEILVQILNRDFNKTNRWTKAAALSTIAANKNVSLSDDIIAQVFNPDPLLREMATWVICKKDNANTLKESTTFYEISPRIKDTVKAELEWLFNYAQLNGSPPPRVSRVEFLKDIHPFSNLPASLLLEIAELLKERRFRQGEKIIGKHEDKNLPVCLVKQGKVLITDNGIEISQLEERSIFGFEEDDITSESLFDIYALEDTVLFEIEKEKLYEIAARDYRMIEVLLSARNIMKTKELLKIEV